MEDLRLANNLLGDTLNPIFSTTEFHGLSKLIRLDLSENMISSLEEGILKGCVNLEVTHIYFQEYARISAFYVIKSICNFTGIEVRRKSISICTQFVTKRARITENTIVEK